MLKSVIEFLSKGGFMMYPLLLSSIIGLSIMIEKMISLRRKKVIIPEIVNVLDNIKNYDDIDLAISMCNKHKGSFANIIKVGLNSKDIPKEEIKEVINDHGRQEVYTLEKGLGILETIAGIAPLMGLLGTVIGILKVFDVIRIKGMGQANMMAGGISEALITTIAGLVIGIPALIVYNYYTNKAEGLILEIEKYSSAMLRKITTFKEEKGDKKNNAV